MSKYPHGPPPPYDYQTQKQDPYPGSSQQPSHGSLSEPGSAYTYVPMPVMMPYQPPQNPTYVTNYIVQPQPTPQPTPHPTPQMPPERNLNRVLEDVIDWIEATPSTAYNFAPRAVVAGHEGWDLSPLWVIRSRVGGDLIPGKLAIKHRSPYVAHAGKEIFVNSFEVLIAQPHTVTWIPASHGRVPATAIVGGNTSTGVPLYIGRARHRLSLTPGKVHPSHGCCYISYAGEEIVQKYYEVLCKVN